MTRPLAPPRDSPLDDVRDPVSEALRGLRMEQARRGSARRLVALEVALVNRGVGVFALHVGELRDADDSWEGGRVFKELETLFPGDPESDQAPAVAAQEAAWSGEVVAVDPVAATVHVVLDPGSTPPVPGGFVVKPFDFLAGLVALHEGRLGAAGRKHLAAQLRDTLHPRVTEAPPLPAIPALRTALSFRWATLWGPPGTGKTWSLGQQVALLAADSAARVLVVSTTNRATDAAAMQAGRAFAERRGRRPRDEDGLRRVGWGADVMVYEANGLHGMLQPESLAARRAIHELSEAMREARDVAERARLRQQMQVLRTSAREDLGHLAFQPRWRVVLATAHHAITALANPDVAAAWQAEGPPFDLVVIDEAGMVSRAAAAALALWSRQRVLLVGDPRQLAPIAALDRVMPMEIARWVAESALGFLGRRSLADPGSPAVAALTAQHRMHPHIRGVVSAYQYDGALTDAKGVRERAEAAGRPERPRALWLCLDDSAEQPWQVRARRGEGGRSWQRPASLELLRRCVAATAGAGLRDALFITPFRAQAVAAQRQLQRSKGPSDGPRWSASTVHAQQGAEADLVVLDTVCASSTTWPAHEWRRLVNVALSRAREVLIVISSQVEMRQPYLRDLRLLLARAVPSGPLARWRALPPPPTGSLQHTPTRGRAAPERCGEQVRARAGLHPVASEEQERLCSLPLDGGARVIRGVAGSGKSWILARWVSRLLCGPAAPRRVLVVFGNAALRGLLQAMVERAWRQELGEQRLPWEQLRFVHVRALLDDLGGALLPGDYDYEAAATRILQRRAPPRPSCDAMFIDEAQDMGTTTLQLLFGLVEAPDSDQPSRKPVHVFYDNDQNVFGRTTPRWGQLGIDARGRTVIMKTSFRSTRPIVDWARNARWTLAPSPADADHRELVSRNLLMADRRRGALWWRCCFNTVAGRPPDLLTFNDRDEELRYIGNRIRHWIAAERMLPREVVVLANAPRVRQLLARELAAALVDTGVRVQVRHAADLERGPDELLVTTAHSFKGHEAELVFVAAADLFIRPVGERFEPLPAALYVAMTRARSHLVVTGLRRPAGEAKRAVIHALAATHRQLLSPPKTRENLDFPAFLRVLTERLTRADEDPAPTRSWLADLAARFQLSIEPVVDAEGAIVAEPLLQVIDRDKRWVVLAQPLEAAMGAALRRLGHDVLALGADPHAQESLDL